MSSTKRLQTILGHLGRTSFSETAKITSMRECSYMASKSFIQDKEFQYTRNGSHLTREQRQFYENNGYLVIEKLVNDQILDLCSNHFVDLCDGACPSNGMFMMKEPTLLKAGAKGQHLIYKIQDILYDDVFSQYTTLPEVLDYVQCFTGPNITAIHSMLINKPPDAQETTVHPLHQDLLYFPFRPANLIVGAWTAMEPVDTENGCLVVLPGSHKQGELLKHGVDSFQTGPYKTFFGVKNLDGAIPIPLSMKKGDTVFLHPLLIHGSGPNRSKRFRKAISCHYAASECYIIDVKNTVHEDIAGSIEATAKKQAGISIDFATVMKMRSQVVRGNEGFTAMFNQ